MLVIIGFLLQSRQAFLITTSSLGIVFPLPMQLCQSEQQSSLRCATTTQHQSLLPCTDTIHRIGHIHIYITYGQVYLVGILLVVVVLGHALQLAYHLARLILARHFRLQHSCIEGHLIGRIGTNNLLQSLVCLVLVARFPVQLSQEIIQSCFGKSSLRHLDGIPQQRYSLLVLTRLYKPCSLAVLIAFSRVHIQAVHAQTAQHILRIIGPLHGYVASCQPCTCQIAHLWLCGI